MSRCHSINYFRPAAGRKMPAKAFAPPRRQKEISTMPHHVEQAQPSCNSRYNYLISEFRCAVLRARLEASDLEAIELALKAGLITAEQALELAADCGALRWIQPTDIPAGAAA
jgi:hypothetical protein